MTLIRSFNWFDLGKPNYKFRICAVVRLGQISLPQTCIAAFNKLCREFYFVTFFKWQNYIKYRIRIGDECVVTNVRKCIIPSLDASIFSNHDCDVSLTLTIGSNISNLAYPI